MDVEKINITDIVPADYNPRKISDKEYSDLSRSIDEFGLVDPIIINLKNNRIIGGHQRYKILLDSDIETLCLIKLGNIGWVFTDTELEVKDEKYEKILNLSLNNLKGEWDENKLFLILEDLTNVGLSLNLTGFSKEELENFYNLNENLNDTIDESKNLNDFEVTNVEEEVEEDEEEKKLNLFYDIIFIDDEEQSKWFDIISIIKSRYSGDVHSSILKCVEEMLCQKN